MDELQRFSFGTPDLVRLTENTVLLTIMLPSRALSMCACAFRVEAV
jgi:hypothetical protein